GFLSNWDEESYISDNHNIERIALSILLSIKKSIEL
ncbi:MAG TPA: N-acetylmuramoyl-L-alanine amidase, partial [Flavobacteriaceae bacterium]|nr:N-acetylmuramoyl-L-alanine amidase [Flavobacteriaceae bacterium]